MPNSYNNDISELARILLKIEKETTWWSLVEGVQNYFEQKAAQVLSKLTINGLATIDLFLHYFLFFLLPV